MHKTEIFWNKQAKSFAKQVDKDIQSFTKILGKAKKHLKTSDIVLDYACGIGTSSIMMSNYVKAIHAIDISSEMIAVAKKRTIENQIVNVNYTKTNIFDEKLENETFEVIMACNILHLLENPQKAIQRIYQLLKPGGLLISTTAFLGERYYARIIFSIISKMRLVPNLQILKTNEFIKYVEAEKFQIIEFEKYQKEYQCYT